MSVVQKIKEWRNDPVVFVKEVFNVVPDKWQELALQSFADNSRDKLRIALRACAGPGKSACLAWMGWNFLLCYAKKGSHPKGAAVSVTFDNLKNGLWTELAHWRNKSKMLQELFTWTQTKIFANEAPETWFLSARSFPRTADLETLGKTLSGIHAEFVLFLIDESGDIPVQVAKAAEQAMGETLARKGFCKIIQAGNPISVQGMLYDASKSDTWFNIRITGDPDDEMRSPRIDKQWAREQINKYGRDDPWVMSYILGHFPSSAINSLLSVEEVELAMYGRKVLKEEFDHFQKRLGVDVARGGMDSTVIFPRQGAMAHKYVELRNANGPQVAARVMQAKNKWGSDMEFIDDTGGFGGSVIDSLELAGVNTHPVHFAGKATDPQYFNIRSEMWFEMAKWIKRGGCLPKCERLKKELLAPTYSFKNGKFALEEKDQIKKRLGFSPDVADALALTFAIVDLPRENAYAKGYVSRNNYKSDYNPIK